MISLCVRVIRRTSTSKSNERDTKKAKHVFINFLFKYSSSGSVSHKQQLLDERCCRGILLMILNSERIYQSIFLSRRLR